MKNPFIWDKYSSQPYPLKDKKYKRKMRLKNSFDYVPLLLSNAVFFPVAAASMKFFKGKEPKNSLDFYGMGICLDDGKEQVELIEELGVKHLLLRLPLWDMSRLDKYVEFVKNFGDDKKILLNIMQDREHIEDLDLTVKHLREIFSTFCSFVSEYQIGNAINRTKWGFFSMSEYLKWFEAIKNLRDTEFKDLKLIGSSVIDFEYHYTVRTLFNFAKVKYDKLSSLLYVDRRGAPQNAQMGIFDTANKINMLYALAKLSPKSSDKIYITEVNWPISNTAPYAPTSEKECVDLQTYTDYMLQYHEIARNSGKIERVYWHRLIAPGYGLVDNREGKLVKYPAFYAYKEMVHLSR